MTLHVFRGPFAPDADYEFGESVRTRNRFATMQEVPRVWLCLRLCYR